ncbi:hypothetical protein QVD17_16118 [Tagetes erecta]|uniref:Uncharacterized protein n=1 Tax=Tagetes erecta TaxID=13708 RepID=A0AAD8KQW3_TARER|nr:hypothetical protein QVD17_16118 [Tagetes erecta]
MCGFGFNSTNAELCVLASICSFFLKYTETVEEWMTRKAMRMLLATTSPEKEPSSSPPRLLFPSHNHLPNEIQPRPQAPSSPSSSPLLATTPLSLNI